MATTVVDQIIQVIEYIGQKFGIAIDWTAENVLPIAQALMERIARWCIAENVFFVALSLVGLILSIIVLPKCIKKLPELEHTYNEDEEILCIGGLILFIIIGIAGVIGICVNTYYLVQSICFPELAVFEYIQSFMSNGG